MSRLKIHKEVMGCSVIIIAAGYLSSPRLLSLASTTTAAVAIPATTAPIPAAESEKTSPGDFVPSSGDVYL